MFPKDLRVEGRRFSCKSYDVNLITSRGKYYYTISKSGIKVLPDILDPTSITVYEDTSSDECAICMTNPKNTIINPCGHYYMCNTCAVSVKSCPICRGGISGLINKSQMD